MGLWFQDTLNMSQTITIPPVKFLNPYRDLHKDKSQIENLNVPIAKNDCDLVRQLRPRQGTFSTTISILWSQLCATLRDRGISGGVEQVADFEQFMSTCRVVDGEEYQQLLIDAAEGQRKRLSNGPVKRPVSNGGTQDETHGPNVGTGTKRIRGKRASVEVQLSDVQGHSGVPSEAGQGSGDTQKGKP